MKKMVLLLMLLLCACDKKKGNFAVLNAESPLYFENMSAALYVENGIPVNIRLKANSTVKIIDYMPANDKHEEMAQVLIRDKNGEFVGDYLLYIPVSKLDF